MIFIEIVLQNHQPVFTQMIGNRKFNIHNITPVFQNAEETDANKKSITSNLYKVFSKYI